MANIKFSGEIAKNILATLAVVTAAAGFTLLLAAAPGFGRVAKEFLDWYNKQNKSRRQRIRKTFEDLRRARLIEKLEMPDGSTCFVLSENGKKKALRYKFDDLRITNDRDKKQWDKKWRMVIFDLPKRFKKERELWRFKLKVLGFHQLQKSIWVHCNPCGNEVDFVTEYLKISPYVRLVEATSIEGDEELFEHFFGN